MGPIYSTQTIVDLSKHPLQVAEIPSLAQKYPKLQMAMIEASLLRDADITKLAKFTALEYLVLKNAKQLTAKALPALYAMRLRHFGITGASNLGYYTITKLPSTL